MILNVTWIEKLKIIKIKIIMVLLYFTGVLNIIFWCFMFIVIISIIYNILRFWNSSGPPDVW